MIIKLKAGLGNIMFQYALGRALELLHGLSNVKYDISYYSNNRFTRILDHFNSMNVRCEIASKQELYQILPIRRIITPKPYTLTYRLVTGIENLFNKDYLLERNHLYIEPEEILNYKYIDGYWQTWKYIEQIKNVLTSEFSPRASFNADYELLLSQIKKSNSVALCIRKGDYLLNSRTKSRFYNCPVEYFEKAIDYILTRVSNPVFFVFTNDEKWVRGCIRFPHSINIVFRNEEELLPDYYELQLIKACKHLVISNSTFHWWGAWLSDDPERIVIRPNNWFADGTQIEIFPPSWIDLGI